MANYDSIHTGEEIDNAVDLVQVNKSKGDSTTPIYFNANGNALAITKSTTPTDSSQQLITSGAVYTGLEAKYNKADISTNTNLGNSNTVISSQGAVKSYVDAQVATRQVPVSAGEGISIDSNVISVADSSEFLTIGDLDNKVNYFNNVNAGYGESLLNKMKIAKRSTFDRSKFTVVGSPIITDDGIADNLVLNSYVEANGVTPHFATANSWKIRNKIMYTSIKEGDVLDWIKFSGYSNSTMTCYLSTNAGADHKIGRVQMNVSTDGESHNEAICYYIGLQPNTYYIVESSFTGSEYRIDVYDETGINLIGSAVSTPTTEKVHSELGRVDAVTGGDAVVSRGVKVDLKAFEVTFDGVEVFNGNKTGIDTLKADDYTIVGTPTISADGIASGFSASNYLYKTISISAGSKIETITKLNDVISASDSRDIFGLVSGSTCLIDARLSATGQNITWIYADSATTRSSKAVIFNYIGDNYIKTVYYNGTLQIYSGPTLDTLSLLDTITGIYDLPVDKIAIGIAYTLTAFPFVSGSIDLNAFKIYVDGNLAYQPCLKIPYTQTKDGKKIVDAIYRNRVEDEYNQVGYTPYFTLSDTESANFFEVGNVTVDRDWVASGFNVNDYLIIDTSSIDWRKPYKIKIKCKLTSSIDGLGTLTYGNMPIIRNHTGKFQFSPASNYDHILTVGDIEDSTSFSLNTDYVLLIEFDGSNYSFSKSTDNGQTYTLIGTKTTSQITTDLTTGGVSQIGNSLTYQPTRVWNGSIDLKQFSVTIDNDSVYSLVLPPNYTMATVKESNIVDSYDNGINKWIKQANLTVKQQGLCTSGTAVTFLKPYRNTDYALSVPYSAKTKTGFTPSASGDWIATGKVNLND